MNLPAKAAIAYDADALLGDAASQDVVDQIAAVEQALAELGVDSVRVPADLDLQAFKQRLADAGPDAVFNLVESLGGSDRLQAVFAMLLEDLKIPFTGSGSLAMLISNHKVETKRRLIAAGIPTPDCAWLDARGNLQSLPTDANPAGDWIVKTLESHASLFMDDASVLKNADAATLAHRLRSDAERHKQPFFAERYIDGREFNLSLLADASGRPAVLPAAEIRFDELAPDKPRIVGYAAKWDEDSAEYVATPRSFKLDAAASALAPELGRLAVAVWDVLQLSGYARVDFRVSEAGAPFVLEANANPCISPDAGFPAAALQAGIGYTEMVKRLLACN